MKIKKQFVLLITIIVAIPVLSLCFLIFERYANSPKRFLIHNYENSEYIKNASEAETKSIFDIISKLPKNVEYLLISDDYKIIFTSNFPEISLHENVSWTFLNELIQESSKDYIYQISKPTSLPYPSILITRIINQDNVINSFKNRLPFFIFIIVCVIISIVYIIYIIVNILDSIIVLKKQTHKLAEGDISEPIEINLRYSNEITEISESLEKMRSSLQDIQNRQNKFIMGLSHDLRTPIAVIKGYVEAITDRIITQPEDIKETMDLIGAKTEKLETMINSLINFMKMDSKEYRSTLVPSSIKSIITDFAKEAENSGRVFNRKITYSIELSKDYFIPLDQQLITRAFENLYSNALRYTKDGDFISISAEDDSQNIYIKFCDTGIGIEKKDLHNIFDMFYRGTNSRREEGMGIGLSVVKNIIDIHNWKISVDSEKNVGTYFTITIPLSQCAF